MAPCGAAGVQLVYPIILDSALGRLSSLPASSVKPTLTFSLVARVGSDGRVGLRGRPGNVGFGADNAGVTRIHW